MSSNILVDLLAQAQATLPAAQAVLAWLEAHPTEAVLADLGAALSADWLGGVVLAIATPPPSGRGTTFDVHQLPRILKSQLATQEAAAIGGILAADIFAAYLNRGDVTAVVVPALVAAAGAYSIPLWRDSAAKGKAIVDELVIRARVRFFTKHPA